MTEEFGLSRRDLNFIRGVLQMYPEIEKALVFGSRAKGNFKLESDIDIALNGKGVGKIISSVKHQLNEGIPLLYHFDVVEYDTISNRDLKDHIDRVGKVLFRR